MVEPAGPVWTVVCRKVSGASHDRDGRPGQDDIAHLPQPTDEDWAVLAVSDGHGSSKSFRSGVGSYHAVQAATDLAEQFLKEVQGEPVLEIEASAKRDLPARIVQEWIRRVKQDQEDHPIREDELAKAGLPIKFDEDETGARKPNLVAYGATLLLVAVCPKYIFYLQLGDGDILALFEDGEEITRPLPPDPTLIGNETTSLCMPRAEKLFRFRFQPLNNGTPPVLIMASTDGYFNAFASEVDFEQAAADFLHLLGSEGKGYVEKNLEGWLKAASHEGSGDDVSVGLIIRADKVKPVQSAPDLEM